VTIKIARPLLIALVVIAAAGAGVAATLLISGGSDESAQSDAASSATVEDEAASAEPPTSYLGASPEEREEIDSFYAEQHEKCLDDIESGGSALTATDCDLAYDLDTDALDQQLRALRYFDCRSDGNTPQSCLPRTVGSLSGYP